MTARTIPPFRADHVGSFIRPDALLKAREAFGKGEIPRAELDRVRQDAIRDVVRLQEELGFKVVTDGEFNRGGWQRDFLKSFSNVAEVPAKMTVKFHSATGTRDHSPATLAVTGKLARPKEIFVADFRFLKSVAKATPKVTIPSPTVLHFRSGRDGVDRKAYPDINAFYADLARVYREEIRDLAAAGLRYIQLDEVNLAYLCDPALQKEVANIGEDPKTLPKTYAKLINDTIAERPRDMVACMHLCRGNYAGSWVAEGGYDEIADILFNEIKMDGYFLEYDSPRAGSFAPLRFLPKGKVAVLGLVTSKSGALETKDELKRRIDEASRHTSLDQLALSPQCGFESGIGGRTMTAEQQAAKLRLVAETAREVWGDT
jgi:5-methyltetrahydropteroyltriglutamate--homocysteine methyltransferase